MTTSAVAIATSANQSLAVPNANVWWGRAHATAAHEMSAQQIEVGVMTFHLEKTGAPTYTYARTIEVMATADSVGNGY